MLTDTEIRREKAFELYVTRNFQGSVEMCLMALVGYPWQPWCYYLIGMNSLALGRRREAQASLTRYIDLEGATFSSTKRKATTILLQLASENLRS